MALTTCLRLSVIVKGINWPSCLSHTIRILPPPKAAMSS